MDIYKNIKWLESVKTCFHDSSYSHYSNNLPTFNSTRGPKDLRNKRRRGESRRHRQGNHRSRRAEHTAQKQIDCVADKAASHSRRGRW